MGSFPASALGGGHRPAAAAGHRPEGWGRGKGQQEPAVRSARPRKNQYLVKFETLNTFDLFDLVKNLQKNNEIEFVEPNFTRLLKPHTNDPFFSQQWTINNNGLLWSSDADMDVDDAWIHSTGSGIKVAIIDEGVDLTHPDLNKLPRGRAHEVLE